MFRIAFIISFMIAPLLMTSQYDWRLEKAKNGIQVYSSKVPNSEFRATKVECTLEGDYDKLISVISDVDVSIQW